MWGTENVDFGQTSGADGDYPDNGHYVAGLGSEEFKVKSNQQ